MIRVDVVVRSDADIKFGGDVHQVRQYEQHLASRADVRVVAFHPAMTLRPDAVIHYVNVDRPFDFLRTVELAGDRRIVVSPIHHSLPRTRRMRMAERGRGLRSLVDRVAPETMREWLASGVRGAKSSPTRAEAIASARNSLRTLPQVPRLWARVGNALDGCAAVAVLASGEQRDLMVDTGWRGRNACIIPNGKPALTDPRDSCDWNTRPINIVAVGRIEPRKRSLELAQAASASGARIVFAGSLGSDRSTYAQQFLNLAKSSPAVDYRGSMSHDEVLRLVGQSRVLINASWVEVQSLVDLEAAHLGTRVISLPNGNSREWLPTHVEYSPGFELDRLIDMATVAASMPEGPGAPAYDWDWQRAADSLYALYSGN